MLNNANLENLKKDVWQLLCKRYQTLNVEIQKMHHLKCYDSLFVRCKINGHYVELTYCLKDKDIKSVSNIFVFPK
jgi:hypothetical protein